MGYEYDLLQRFANAHDLDLEVRIMYSLDEFTKQLYRGEGDVIAANLTVTKDRTKRVNFSDPLLQTRQVLVQHRQSPNKVMEVHELIGREVHVPLESSFYHRLMNIEDELGAEINIVALADSGEFRVPNKTLQLIDRVANQKIEITVADENIAKVEKKMKPQLHISTAISFPQNIGWALRKNDTVLLSAINEWLAYEKKRNDYYTIYTKYFRARTKLKQKIISDYSSQSGGISPYDDVIKKYSSNLNWDWRLLSAQVYQESKFDPNAVAWTGATGLMQLLPTTAQAYDVDSSLIKDPESNIKAGVSYLKWLDKCWSHTVTDSLERIKFVLASFNVGLGHIIDARNLASKYGDQPDLWDDHVAKYILLKSEPKYYRDEVCKHGYCRGSEPFNYVNSVMNRYGHYLNLIPE